MRYLTRTRSLSVWLLTAVTAFTLGTSAALADSLGIVPLLGADDTSNQGLAITPDGQYIVGLSSGGSAGDRGFLYQVGAGSAINVLSSDGAQSQTANGVGYRTYNGQVQLIISGMTSSGEAEYMTADGGTTFGAKRRNANWTYGLAMGSVNQLGSGLGSDAYYVSTRSTAQTSQLVVMKGAGAWVPPSVYYIKGISADRGGMNGMSASGRAVGYRGTSTSQANKRNYVLDAAASSAFFFNGLDGTDSGEAMSVSADGNTVFGRSRTVSDPNNYYGYKVVNPGASETINALPELAGTGGSTSRTIPYGASADGKLAVGMDYIGHETAALWNTASANPADWSVIDLTQLASDEGILDGWSLLSRAYSVGQYWDEANQNTYAVITGVGDWSPDGGVTPYATRAFVMTVLVPEPTTGALLGLGLLALLGLRRRK